MVNKAAIHISLTKLIFDEVEISIRKKTKNNEPHMDGSINELSRISNGIVAKERLNKKECNSLNFLFNIKQYEKIKSVQANKYDDFIEKSDIPKIAPEINVGIIFKEGCGLPFPPKYPITNLREINITT